MKRRWVLIAVAVLVLGAIWLSQQSAEAFKPAAANAIERALGRKVEINREAHFLPWRLGFSLTDVVIHDDPRFGLEPLAYVAELQATIRLSALLRGRLEFNRLRMVDPSVNLAQGPNGWNFPALLNQALGSAAETGEAPPEVDVTGGRLNIRFGDTKSVYYLWDANLTLEPGSRTDQLSIYFDGVPARTDRGTKGFGRLSARGTVDLGGDRKVKIQAALERSAASELLMLFQDNGSSVTGFFSGNAKLEGPVDALQLDGRLQLHEFQRWAWLTAAGTGPAIDWTGLVNWNAQTVHLNTKPDTLPVSVVVDGNHLLGAAQWFTAVTIRDTPAEALQTLAQEFGFALPGGMALMGKLDGDVSYATKAGLTGNIDFSGGSLSLANKEMAEVEPTLLHFIGRKATLDPVVIRQHGDVVRLEASYDWDPGAPGLSWAFSGPELDLGRASEWGMALPGRVHSGKWRGNLRYEAATGGWHGEGDLLDAAIDAEGLAAKVHLDSARVKLQGAEFTLSRMIGRIDDVEFRGDFQYDPAATAQSQLQLQLNDLPVSAVGGWISPAFERRRSVLSRTLGLATGPAPDFVEGRRLTAQIQAKSLRFGQQSIPGPFAMRVSWSKGVVQMTGITGPGRLRGEGELELSNSALPSQFKLENLPWHRGLADVSAEFDSLATPSKGTFQINARDFTLIEGERWASGLITGDFEARVSMPSFTFKQIEIHSGTATDGNELRGSGQSLADGTWEWNVLSVPPPGKNRKLIGPVFEGFWKENP